MSRQRQMSHMQALAAQKRDSELRRTEELKRVALYFDRNTRASRHHEAWTAPDYYERANREAEQLGEKKIKAAKLEERRKKLEFMLFQENMQHQNELKALSAQPKYYRNSSYLNDVPTSVLQDINQGIREKEEDLRRHEAELRLHHAWRAQQPEIRAAESYMRNGRLKSAWTKQIVEKEIQKKKEEEDTRKALQERDETIRQQIQVEQENLKIKELQMKELRSNLEEQITKLSDKEKAVKEMRKQEEKERLILDELQFIAAERIKEHARLAAERNVIIVNMGLYKYKLKIKVSAVLKEITLELEILEKLKKAVFKDYIDHKDNIDRQKRLLDTAYEEMLEHRERDKQRQRNIDAMYDGEARQLSEKQDKIWAKESEARACLMEEVLATLQKQIQEKIESSREKQKENVLEREKILDQVDSFYTEVKTKEHEKQLRNSAYCGMTALQGELNKLKLEQKKLEEKVAQEASIKQTIAKEEMLRKELAKIHREGYNELPTKRRVAW